MFNYTEFCIMCNSILHNVTKLHTFGVEMQEETYSERLRKFRSKLGLSVAKLAAVTGIPARTISSYERGEYKPSFDFLSAMYELFEMNINWIISGVGQMKNPKKFEDVEDVMEAKVMAILKKQGVIE